MTMGAHNDPMELYLLALTLGALAREITRAEIVHGSRADLISDVLARGDTGELVSALRMHAEPSIDAAALARAVAKDPALVWCEVVGQLLARRGPDEVAFELNQCAERLRSEAIRTHARDRLTNGVVRR